MSTVSIKRLGVFAATGVLALATASTSLAVSAGDPNADDVWTDNVGQPSGPGHEQDPHLACHDINLWGSGLADGSGTYTIDGWAPSGSQEQDYASGWSYNQSVGGAQVIDVISVSTLIADAVKAGDAPVNKQGYHFKLQFSQDPQKHKTFWVNCPAPTGSGGSTTPPPVTQPTGTPTQPATQPGGSAPVDSVDAAHKRRHKPRRQHKLVRPKRHVKPRRRTRHGVGDAAPEFTG